MSPQSHVRLLHGSSHNDPNRIHKLASIRELDLVRQTKVIKEGSVKVHSASVLAECTFWLPTLPGLLRFLLQRRLWKVYKFW